ncbi:tryptophan--tRNA ligase [Bdellovibrionota bacterium FG-2]
MQPQSARKVMLSAVQPSNHLTIGNYLGAIKNWVKLQHDYECLFFAVDLHTITVRQDPKEMRDQTYRAIATYIAAGLDPKDVTLFVQSHVPEHAELAWVLNCFTYMGELGRMTQFKDKSAAKGGGESRNIPAGLFNYPVLMASDILLYQTHLVPVGEDQKQHLELTRDLAIRMNNLYGKDTFRVPEPYIAPVAARIASLQNPTQKMSKSDPDPNASIFLTDSDDVILKKLKRAVTDSGSEITFDEESKPGVSNLLTIQSAITGKSMSELVNSYAGKQYGHLKLDTAAVITETLAPLRGKTDLLLKDLGYLNSVLKEGAEKARARAHVTLERVYERVGFIGLDQL